MLPALSTDELLMIKLIFVQCACKADFPRPDHIMCVLVYVCTHACIHDSDSDIIMITI